MTSEFVFGFAGQNVGNFKWERGGKIKLHTSHRFCMTQFRARASLLHLFSFKALSGFSLISLSLPPSVFHLFPPLSVGKKSHDFEALCKKKFDLGKRHIHIFPSAGLFFLSLSICYAVSNRGKFPTQLLSWAEERERNGTVFGVKNRSPVQASIHSLCSFPILSDESFWECFAERF